ncbi:MAG: type II toxin-antitoxin system RelE/ParE family toxin [Spirochaetes bacterium]|nr:type II toxin-antitoxin system RelE/ParE family toxin [Spirochaetota bacterium]
MINVTIINEAKTELFESIGYYEEKSKGLGVDLYKEIKSAIEIIKRFPECCALRKDETRRFLINRFPYLIIYIYYENRIWIIAFAHCKRRPRYWANRKK